MAGREQGADPARVGRKGRGGETAAVNHALTTGSSRGVGRGIALKLAEDGVKVAVHYYKNDAAAKETLAEVRRRGSDGLIVQADVVSLLCSERASWITAQVIYADGVVASLMNPEVPPEIQIG